MSSSLDVRRIVRNTLLLYGRMLLTVGLNLWTTRLTLQHLGVSDLGVYGVIGSVVTMFGVFTGGISSAVQRFITFELGRGASGHVDRVFSTSFNLLLILAAILLFLFETIGLWILNTRLNIPSESLSASRWVFHFSVIAFLANVIAIPYNALVIAHERMSFFAAVSVLQVALNCAAAWMLSLFADGRLIIYGASMAFVAILIRAIYQIYCHRHYPEARFRWGIARQEVREMARFAGASTLSGAMLMMSGEGLMLIINLTFGVAVNAVYSISLQLKNMILSFALNVFKAIQPQITKTYAEGDYSSHLNLVYTGSKVEVFLIYLLMLPFLCRTEQIMTLWLGEVPKYTVAFVRGTIFISLTYAAFEPIRTAVLATGRVVRFLLIPDAFYLLVLPVGYLVAKTTGSPDCMLVSIVGMDILACMLRVWLGAKVSPIRIRQLFISVVLPCLGVGILGAGLCAALSRLLPDTLPGLLALVLLNAVVLLAMASFYYYPLLKRIWTGHRPQ